MATKRNKKPSKKVKTLRTKSVSAKQAKGVRGGTTPGTTLYQPTPGNMKYQDINLKRGVDN